MQPKYPLGFDCSAVAAGSQRQACNRSHLDPPMGAIEQPKRMQPDSLLRQPAPHDLPKKVRRVRLQVLLPEEIVEAVDDYRFAIHAPNRAEVVRQLLKVGQAARPPEEQSD